MMKASPVHAMRIFDLHLYAGFLVQFPSPKCVYMLCAQPLVDCVGTILFVDDLINLFVQDEILECRLQIINVTSFLIEFTFTQMLKI